MYFAQPGFPRPFRQKKFPSSPIFGFRDLSAKSKFLGVAFRLIATNKVIEILRTLLLIVMIWMNLKVFL